MEKKMMEQELNFGEALDRLREGKKVARVGWNGKGMWIALSEPKKEPVSNISSYITFNEEPFETLPFIVMKTADDKVVPWLASQTDILANDWEVV